MMCSPGCSCSNLPCNLQFFRGKLRLAVVKESCSCPHVLTGVNRANTLVGQKVSSEII